ncbi:MAG: hypothetical protein JXR83_01545 [Deltaproteobacteria bacterium]|nr:hypothetical protein [Deltaproteobacteria bacterium]
MAATDFDAIFGASIDGGFGGPDLYAMSFDGTNRNTPVNLGATVNDAGEPTLDLDGNLYFVHHYMTDPAAGPIQIVEADI